MDVWTSRAASLSPRPDRRPHQKLDYLRPCPAVSEEERSRAGKLLGRVGGAQLSLRHTTRDRHNWNHGRSLLLALRPALPLPTGAESLKGGLRPWVMSHHVVHSMRKPAMLAR